MRKFNILFAAATMLLAAGSCSEEEFAVDGGEGRLMLKAKLNTEVRESRAAEGETELAESCLVWISNSKGLVRKYNGIDNIPADGIKLVSDKYIAEVWAGDSVSASFDKRWFKGSQAFEITAGSSEQVTVNCKIANVVVKVNYADNVEDVLTDYTMTVEHNRGSLVFEGRDTRDGYFMMPSTSKDLKWTLRGKIFDGSEYVRTGTIPAVKPATRYTINVNSTPDDTEVGGGYFTIEVDETEIVFDDELVLAVAPDIAGSGFDISKGLKGSVGTIARHSVFVSSASKLTSVVVECDEFNALIGLDGNNFDFYGMSQTVSDIVSAGGINNVTTIDEVAGTELMKINFEKTFMDKLQNGNYNIKFTATNQDGKTATATMAINVSDALVYTEDVDEAAITTNSVVLRGTVAKDGIETVGFQYRRKGTATWTKVDGVVETRSFTVGQVFTAEVTDLAPETTYEYAAVSGDFVSTVKTFTTEAEFVEPQEQLPNASFENWFGSKPILIGIDGEPRFWDSGNHGSATMSKNVTQSSTDYVHSGTYSAKLASQFVGIGSIGKFAAGNIFSGTYVETQGTDGVLGWGQPFTSRPKAMKVWVKYNPQPITHADAACTDPDLVKDAMDKGLIYMALMDDNTVSHTLSGSPANGLSKGQTVNYPVIIKTKASERQLFKNGEEFNPLYKDHVIAYGEHVFTAATEGDGMVEITIPLEYYKQDVYPTYIVLVASASKGGDFFTGGPSVMYIDDIEMVY